MLKKEETKKLKEFTERIKINAKNLELLKIALTHRSYINEIGDQKAEHNERLEFLGDAVLELLVSKHLYNEYPQKTEGELTSFRAATVRTESLYEESKRLEFGKYLYMSKGEEQTGGRTRPYILANTFEAIVGFIYLDQGLQITERFVKHNLCYKIPEIVDKRLDIDDKSKLQEIAQEIIKETPVYQIVDSTGPDHAKKFVAQVIIKGKPFGRGKGANKQEAEQNAAKDALDNWKELISTYFGID